MFFLSSFFIKSITSSYSDFSLSLSLSPSPSSFPSLSVSDVSFNLPIRLDNSIPKNNPIIREVNIKRQYKIRTIVFVLFKFIISLIAYLPNP